MSDPISVLRSRSIWNADGVTTVWNFQFAGGYINRSTVKAYTQNPDGSSKTTVAISDPMFIGPNQLSISPAVAAGKQLVIYRDSSNNGLPFVDFTDGNRLTSSNLDITATQGLFVAVEMDDYVGVGTTADLLSLGQSAALSAGAAGAYALNAANSATAAAASANGAVAAAAQAQSYATSVGNAVTKLAQLISTKEYGAVANGVANDAAAVSAANFVAIAKGAQLIIQGVHHIATPITITVPIADTLTQIFTATSQVTIDNGLPVRPEWWGMGQNTVHLAGMSLPAKGGTVLLEAARYQKNNHVYNGKAWTKDNVTFQGRGMGRYSPDMRKISSGTVIEGRFLCWANNCSFRDLAIDSGNTYTTTVNGGVAEDGLVCTYDSDTSKNSGTRKLGLHLHNVSGLCNGPTDAVHAVIACEGYAGTVLTGQIMGAYGIHGVVIKAIEVTGGADISAFCNSVDGVIIKTDSNVTASSINVQIGNITAYAGAPLGYVPYVTATGGAGLFIHAKGGNISLLQIGNVESRGHAYGVLQQMDLTNYTIDNVQIGNITTDTNSAAGFYMVGTFANSTWQRCQFGNIVTRNTPSGCVFAWPTSSAIQTGWIHAVNCTNTAVAVSDNADPTMLGVIAENCASVWQISANGKPRCGNTVMKGTTSVEYSPTSLVPTLATGWGVLPGQDNFRVAMRGFGVELEGLVGPGGGSINLITMLPVFARPFQTLRFTVGVMNSGTESTAIVTVFGTGQVYVNFTSGVVPNTWVSLRGIRYTTLP